MRTPYKAADREITVLKKYIQATFHNAENKRSFDEINIRTAQADTKALYKALSARNLKSFQAIAEDSYREAYKDAEDAGYSGEKKKPDVAWLLLLLSAYDPVTLYVYDHEIDRKRARMFEAMVATKEAGTRLGFRKSVRSARNLWEQASVHYADTVEDGAVLKAFKDAGVTHVKWNTEQDEKVCEKCAPRDGEVYPIDEAPPKEHYKCRCYYTPAGKE